MTSIYLAQLNVTVGDIAGNAERIHAAHAKAKEAGAELVVYPELCVIGYPPEDLIFTPKLRRDAMAMVEALAALTAGDAPAILLGCVWEEVPGFRFQVSGKESTPDTRPPTPETSLYNAALLLDGGKIQHIQYKHHLPNYGVFDEKRVFERGSLPEVMNWRGRKLGVLICEDMWGEEASRHLAAQQPELIVCINASPFEQGKHAKREALASREARSAGCPLVYLNQVGGQDELVFDGGSFVMDAQGRVVERLAFFEEELFNCPCSGLLASAIGDAPLADGSCERTVRTSFSSQLSTLDPNHLLYSAMTVALRDYVDKNGFPGVVLGLSGGIDSALTACVCVDALGAERVHCVMLPSPYTSQMSLEDAAALAANLGVAYDILPISEGMEAAEQMLKGLEANGLRGRPEGTAACQKIINVPTAIAFENIQSRLRGLLLMAISNSTGKLLITTGNKSEMATGYATLYGDMCGAFSVLKDVYKTQVFALARWRNEQQGSALIPERTITRPPSAELREGQVDEDSLPPYEVLDAILFHLVEERLAVDEVVSHGQNRAIVEKVARLLYISEYKRRQAPPGVKLTAMAFGRDRRFPLTNRFKL